MRECPQNVLKYLKIKKSRYPQLPQKVQMMPLAEMMLEIRNKVLKKRRNSVITKITLNHQGMFAKVMFETRNRLQKYIPDQNDEIKIVLC